MISLIVPTRPSIRKVAPLAVLLLAFPLLIAVLYLGTPDPAQAVTIDRCGSLESNETWTKGNVYVVTCDYFVMGGVTLTIQAGTVVKFDHRVDDLHVIGDLIVQGTASEPVVFTSYQDDSHGGDTNGDGAATSPAPGDWGSVNLRNSANTLVYTLIQYGGGGDNFGNAYGGLHILDSSPTVEHNIIRFNDIYGIYVENGSPTISNNIIQDSTQYGLYVNSGSANVNNNTIENSGQYGLVATIGSPTISSNSFTDSAIRHLYQGAEADPTYTSNTFSGTGGGAIEIFGDSLSTDVTWANVQGMDWPYLVRSDLNIESGGTLRLPAGMVVKFENSSLTVFGTLDVQGTADNRVVFTSYKDDSYGGDTNGDGSATSPAAGDWGSIQLNNSANTLDYTTIQYGGSYNGGVYISGSSPTVASNLIRYNNYGLYISSGSPTISGNTFTDSGTRHLKHGVRAEPTYSGNTFSGTGGGVIDVKGGGISSDITWENVQGLNWPYLLDWNLTILDSGILRLPAGAIIKFDDQHDLIVEGILDVQGTDSNLVVFTSYKDDTHGGDTNGDGAATTPAPGDWGSIKFDNSANTLDYAIIQYGGGGDFDGGIYIINSSPTIEHNLIRYNDDYGIYISNGSPTIKDNMIEDSTGYGLYLYRGSPTIEGNKIKNSSGYGLSISNSSPNVTNNDFIDSGTRHLYHSASANPTYSGNTFSGTGGGAIDVKGDGITGIIMLGDTTWENIQGLNWPYLLLSDLIIGDDVTLTIQAGTGVKFENSYLYVHGTLDVQGTADNRVVFTSYKDDSYGGDTNGDGAATTPAPGDWGPLTISNSANTLDYALIQYGGAGNLKGGIRIYEASPTIEHNIIRYNNHGIYVNKGFPTIRHNDITGNTDYGVYNYTSNTIDAANNWWGHLSGPSGVGPGSGDAVSDYVNYTPWLDAPANPITDPLPPSSSLLTYLPFVLR